MSRSEFFLSPHQCRNYLLNSQLISWNYWTLLPFALCLLFLIYCIHFNDSFNFFIAFVNLHLASFFFGFSKYQLFLSPHQPLIVFSSQNLTVYGSFAAISNLQTNKLFTKTKFNCQFNSLQKSSLKLSSLGSLLLIKIPIQLKGTLTNERN